MNFLGKCRLPALRSSTLLVLALSLVLQSGLSGCASTDENNASGPERRRASMQNSTNSGNNAAAAQRARARNFTTGRSVFVTTTLGNEPTLEGSLPSNVLSEVLLALDEIARKESDNVPLMVTYLGLLRLHGQSPDLYQNIERRAGMSGAKDVWLTLEAGYGALRRREFGLADYLFARAEKNAGSNAMAKGAIAHAFGVSALLSGKVQEGILQMRKAATANPPYLPSLLTLGFLGLQHGDYEGSERMFSTALATFPNSLNARLGLATAYRARGKVDQAIANLQGLYRTRSNDRRIAWNYALALSQKPASHQEAISVLTKYFEMPGSIPEIDAKANELLTRLNSQRPSTAQTTTN